MNTLESTAVIPPALGEHHHRKPLPSFEEVLAVSNSRQEALCAYRYFRLSPKNRHHFNMITGAGGRYQSDFLEGFLMTGSGLPVPLEIASILRDWQRSIRPGFFVSDILRTQGIKVQYVAEESETGHCLETNTLKLPKDLSRGEEAVRLCGEWLSLRIHRATGEPSFEEDLDFVTRWLEEFFLPPMVLIVHPLVRADEGESDVGVLERLAEEFCCVPGLVESALRRRGYVATFGEGGAAR